MKQIKVGQDNSDHIGFYKDGKRIKVIKVMTQKLSKCHQDGSSDRCTWILFEEGQLKFYWKDAEPGLTYCKPKKDI